MSLPGDINKYQRPFTKFREHQFFVHVLAQDRLYDAQSFEQIPKTNGIDVVAKRLSFGSGTQTCEGSIALKIRVCDLDRDISWTVSATCPRLLKGIKVEITNIPFKSMTDPFGQNIDIDDGSGYASTFPAGAYPNRVLPTSDISERGSWLPMSPAQFMLINAPDHTILIRSEDYPPQFKRYWFFRNGRSINLVTYTEANGSEKKKIFSSPRYFLEKFDSISDAVKIHAGWMRNAYKLVPFNERKDVPKWVKNICLNLNFHCHATDGAVLNTFSTIEKKLEQTAKFFDPKLTHIHIVGWDGQWDYTWPGLIPDLILGGEKGLKQLVKKAHTFGYHIDLHMNVMGLSYQNPDFEKIKHFLEHQIRDIQDRRVDWEYDWDGDEVDEKIFAYISPDHKPWRDYLIDRILAVVKKYQIDNVLLDQATTIINDNRHNHVRGLNALFKKLREVLPPEIVISGEGTSEPVLGLYPLATHMVNADQSIVPQLLFDPFVRIFEYGHPTKPGRSIWSNPWRKTKETIEKETATGGSRSFYENLKKIEERKIIPSILFKNDTIRADSVEAKAVYKVAARIRDQLEID